MDTNEGECRWQIILDHVGGTQEATEAMQAKAKVETKDPAEDVESET